MGKPISEARSEARSIAARVESFIRAADQALADDAASGITASRVRWRPPGVVGVIAPWNYPVATPR